MEEPFEEILEAAHVNVFQDTVELTAKPLMYAQLAPME